MTRIRNISWAEFFEELNNVDLPGNYIYGVPKGGMIAAGFLKKAASVHHPSMANMILDDIVDSGKTEAKYREKYPKIPFTSLFVKENPQVWLVFPWEADHPGKEDSIHENIIRMLQFIGEDPLREGLQDTPERVIRAWRNELFVGYQHDSKNLLTTFKKDGYDQIILCRDIELFSMCEHHLMPFFGKAHVAYIPGERIIGISKLARLVDVYARRLQIQERIGEQVTADLMNYLEPKGAACIINAVHMCMRMRGCSKQHSSMTTSSVKGVFYEDHKARQELMELIKG